MTHKIIGKGCESNPRWSVFSLTFTPDIDQYTDIAFLKAAHEKTKH